MKTAIELFDELNARKRGLIILRELGAIDNFSYRQQSGLGTLTASQELRSMRDIGLLEMKGKGSATYYVPGPDLLAPNSTPFATDAATSPGLVRSGQEHQLRIVKTPGGEAKTPAGPHKTPVAPPKTPDPLRATPGRDTLLMEMTENERIDLMGLRRRQADPGLLQGIVLRLCARRAYTNQELAVLFEREEKGLRRKFLQPLIAEGKLRYKYPGAVSHPDQAYITA